MKRLLPLILIVVLLLSVSLTACQSAGNPLHTTTANQQQSPPPDWVADAEHVDTDNNGLCDDCGISVVVVLDLFAINVDEYLEFECLLKYNVEYIAGTYLGGNASTPTEIEYTRTRLLSKIIKDSLIKLKK